MSGPCPARPVPPSPGRALALAGLALALGACGGKRKHDLVVRAGPELAAAPEQVAVAPAVLVHAGQLDLAQDEVSIRDRPLTSTGDDGELMDEDPPTEAEAELLDVFYKNLFVGKVWLGGGYDMLPVLGNQVRSLKVTLSKRREFAAQALEWTDGAVSEVLAERGIAATPVSATVEAALQPPAVRAVRGSGPLDGEDNQNLPRIEVVPAPLDPAALPDDLGAPVLLVPMVVHYYAHNGGWFVGQSDGVAAGARFRLLWALHDVQTGQVLTWGDASARYVEPYFYSPNDVQLQDYLLDVEAQVRGVLDDELLD